MSRDSSNTHISNLERLLEAALGFYTPPKTLT